MKLMIDIPERIYNEIKRNDASGQIAIIKAVQNSIPLSESEDCVSREAAIKAICKHCTPEKPERCPTAEICHSYQELKALSSVAPKQRTGQWIDEGDRNYRCSKCQELSCCMGNYCSECGAKMQEVEK